jgi:hypothetical protein
MVKKFNYAPEIISGFEQIIEAGSKDSKCTYQILIQNQHNCEAVAYSIGVCDAEKMWSGIKQVGGEEGDIAPARIIAPRNTTVHFYTKSLKHDDTVRLFGKETDPKKMEFLSMYVPDMNDLVCSAKADLLRKRPIIDLGNLSFSIQPSHSKGGWKDYLPGGKGQMYDLEGIENKDDRRKVWEAFCNEENEIILDLRIRYYVYHKGINENKSVYCPNPSIVLEQKEQRFSQTPISEHITSSFDEKKERDELTSNKKARERQSVLNMLCGEYIGNNCKWQKS